MTFDNFLLRPIDTKDAEGYFALVDANRGRIARYFPNVAVENRDIGSTMLFVAERMRLAEKGELVSYVLWDGHSNRIAGSIFLKSFDRHVQKCELSFFIDHNYEGKGITTKAVALLAGHCFRELHLNKVYMRIAEDNIPSRRVAEKNGFMAEGILRQDFRTPAGDYIDVVYYGLLRNTAGGESGG